MKRYLLKISGEVFGSQGFDAEKAKSLAQEIKEARKYAELAVVLGAGNIWRGRESTAFGFPAAASDAIGMAATLLNAAVLRESLTQIGVPAKVFSPHTFTPFAHAHIIPEEQEFLASGGIVIFAGGTGAPFFTTDSAAVLRALEIEADAVLKGTKVDGVYSDDPEKNPDATRYDVLSYDEALKKDLKIMDATAFALARERSLPLFVFSLFGDQAIEKAAQREARGTWVQ